MESGQLVPNHEICIQLDVRQVSVVPETALPHEEQTGPWCC
jgi:hypothetical protein